MEHTFFLTIVPHETSPPPEEHAGQLMLLLTKLGKLHEFAMLLNGRMFRAKLCSRFNASDLEEAFRGMTVNVQVQEEQGECHDCQLSAA